MTRITKKTRPVPPRCCVTGGSGFVGQRLVGRPRGKALVKNDDHNSWNGVFLMADQATPPLRPYYGFLNRLI